MRLLNGVEDVGVVIDGKVLEVTVLLLNDFSVVGVGWGDLDDSLEALALGDASWDMLWLLLLAIVEALLVAVHVLGGLHEGLVEVSLHGHDSLLMSHDGSVELGLGGDESFLEGSLGGLIGDSLVLVVFLDSGLFLLLGEGIPLGVAVGSLEALGGGLCWCSLLGVWVEAISIINALGGLSGVALLIYADGVEVSHVLLLVWLHDSSVVDSNMSLEGGVSMGHIGESKSIISLLGGIMSLSPSFPVILSSVKLGLVPLNSWEPVFFTGDDGTEEGEYCELHILME